MITVLSLNVLNASIWPINSYLFLNLEKLNSLDNWRFFNSMSHTQPIYATDWIIFINASRIYFLPDLFTINNYHFRFTVSLRFTGFLSHHRPFLLFLPFSSFFFLFLPFFFIFLCFSFFFLCFLSFSLFFLYFSSIFFLFSLFFFIFLCFSFFFLSFLCFSFFFLSFLCFSLFFFVFLCFYYFLYVLYVFSILSKKVISVFSFFLFTYILHIIKCIWLIHLELLH